MGKKWNKFKGWCEEHSHMLLFGAGLTLSTIVSGVAYDKAYRKKAAKTYDEAIKGCQYDEQIYKCLNQNLDEHPENVEKINSIYDE